MERLKDKIAVVTGAADGIGLAISEAFIAEGATIVMADINDKKCKEEALRLGKSGIVTSLKCDVAQLEDIQNMVQQTLNTYGGIDILVNNAAIAVSGNITEMPEEDWDLVLNTNLKNIFRSMKLVIPHMQKQKMGSIINISSMQAYRSWENWTAYAGAKGAMLSMTNQLAGQFGKDNVRVNTISPGAILTPMNEKRAEKEGSAFLKSAENMAAMQRMGTPQEVAMTAVFLASEESSFITGEDIKVDGGLSTLSR